MRTKIATTDTYSDAMEVKKALVEKFPDKKFQIRRRPHEFLIVERVSLKPDTKEQKRGNSV
jgi:hypothetical protein